LWHNTLAEAKHTSKQHPLMQSRVQTHIVGVLKARDCHIVRLQSCQVLKQLPQLQPILDGEVQPGEQHSDVALLDCQGPQVLLLKGCPWPGCYVPDQGVYSVPGGFWAGVTVLQDLQQPLQAVEGDSTSDHAPIWI
jgi:hypothetical protein